MNSKELVQRTFARKDVQRHPFIPIVSSLAARIRRITVREMLSKPTILANSILDAHRLFQYDGIVPAFDLTLEAEALGAPVNWEGERELPSIGGHPLEHDRDVSSLSLESFEKKGRIPVVLEAAKRLEVVIGKEVAIIAPITGPFTLAFQLGGETFLRRLEEGSSQADGLLEFCGRVALKMAKLYCEQKADGVIVVETARVKTKNLPGEQVVAIYRSLSNVIRFYGSAPILLIKNFSLNQLKRIFTLGVGGVIHRGEPRTGLTKDLFEDSGLCFAGVIPLEVFKGSAKEVAGTVKDFLQLKMLRRGFFLTGEWEIPYLTPLENIHVIMEILREEGRAPRDYF